MSRTSKESYAGTAPGRPGGVASDDGGRDRRDRFLGLGGVFSSVMTANIVLLGLSAGKLSGSLALHAGAALTGYIVGAVAASRVTASAGGPLRSLPCWSPKA